MRVYMLDLSHRGVMFKGRPVGRPFEKARDLVEALKGLKDLVAHARSFRLLCLHTPYFDLKVDRLGVVYLSKEGYLLHREYGKGAFLFKRELRNWLHCLSDVLAALTEGRDYQ